MVEPIRYRPDFDVLAAEHLAELAKSPEHRSSTTRLQSFVLALKKIQERDYNDESSFFWLASYHGGSSKHIYQKQREIAGRPTNLDIFCAHAIPQFPGWHRIYIRRFEEALQKEDPTVMLPFWNQLSKVSMEFGYHELIAKKTFELVNGDIIDNPLFSFNIKQDIYFGYNGQIIFSKKAGPTVRNSGGLPRYIQTTHPSLVKSALKVADYINFSNTGNTSGETSLEEPHNYIHGYTGGHMSNPILAAFDPIFWLHHCYIDYLFWHWQVDHNQTEKLIMPSIEGNKALDPFRRPDGRFYILYEMASTQQFGYAYKRLDINFKAESSNARRLFHSLRSTPLVHKSEASQRSLVIDGIKYAKFGGNFFVKAIAYTAGGKVNLGKSFIFHNSGGCDNCLINDSSRLIFRLKNIRQEHEERIRFKVRFYLHDNVVIEFSTTLTAGLREFKHFYGTAIELSY